MIGWGGRKRWMVGEGEHPHRRRRWGNEIGGLWMGKQERG